MSMTSTPLPDLARVHDLLRREYTLDVRLTRIAHGESAYNFRGDGATGNSSVFVKVYRDDAHRPTEELCCRQSEIASAGGVLTAKLRYGRSGTPIVASDGVMLSVWKWIDGTTSSVVDPRYAVTVGNTLKRIHDTFHRCFGPATEAPAVTRWQSKSVETVTAELVDLRARAVTGCGRADCAFDTRAVHTLDERLRDLEGIEELRRGTEGLSAQVIHGDYSPINLIVTHTNDVAVVDFAPPDPFLVAYDLGRIAMFPGTNVDRATAYATALDVIRGYLSAGESARHDVLMSPRVALIQLVTSLYGVREHFVGGGVFQDRLDAFWIARHEVAHAMLRDLPQLELAVAELLA